MVEKNLKSKTIKKFAIVIGCILAVSIILSVGLCIQNPKLIKQVITTSSYDLPRSSNSKETEAIGVIFGNNVVEQTFLSKKDNIMNISIGFVAYERFNDSHVTVELWDDKKEKMYETWTISAYDLTSYYNKNFTLEKKIENAKDKIYRVVIYSKDATVRNGISVHKMINDVYEDGKCYVNGNKVNGNIRLLIGYELEKPITYNMKINVVSLFMRICIYLSFIYVCINQMVKLAKNKMQIKKKMKKLWNTVKEYKKMVYISTCVTLVMSVFVAFGLPLFSYEEDKTNFHFMGFLWCLVLGFVICFLLLCKKINYKKTEVIFAVIAMIFGCLFVFGEPVSTAMSWDDEIHYGEVIKLSYLSDTCIRKADSYMLNCASVDEYQIKKIGNVQELLNASYYGEENIISHSTAYYTSIYNKLGYLPSALVHGIGRSIKMPYTWIFCLGKFANLVLYTSLVYIGMKYLKHGKTILAAIALFPTNIFQASNYTYDYWVNALTMLGIACIFSLLQRYKKEEVEEICISSKEKNKRILCTIGILVILFLAIGPKAIYFPLLSLILILPHKNKKRKIKRWGIILIFFAILFVAVYSFTGVLFKNGFGSGDWRGGYQVNSDLQVRFILENPLEYTKILLKYLFGTYLQLSNSVSYTNRLGCLGISFFGDVSMLMLLVAMVFDRGTYKELTWKIRIFVGGVLFGTLSLVATALYISFTPVMHPTINGCQARYFLPLIFPLAYIISNQKLTNFLNQRIETKKWYYMFFILEILVLFGNQFTLLVMRYY